MLYEDDVVDAVCAHLTATGWTIESTCHGHEHGDDIVASRDGMRLIVEAKGETSGTVGTNRHGKAFSRGQANSHVSRAVFKAMAVTSTGKATGAVALPDERHHRHWIGQVATALERLGIVVFWVRPDRSVEVQGSLP